MKQIVLLGYTRNASSAVLYDQIFAQYHTSTEWGKSGINTKFYNYGIIRQFKVFTEYHITYKGARK